MKSRKPLAILALATSLLWASSAQAHCDTLDGPVVSAGKAALDSGNVNLALVWVPAAQEQEVRAAFQKSRAVRAQGGEARDLADMYFYETLVRVHRASENAPYTGLKPAGQVEPPVAAADQAIAAGNLRGLRKLIAERSAQGLNEHFDKLMAARNYDPNDVAAGRDFTSAYVEFTHYAERLYDSAGPATHAGAAGGSTDHAH